MASNHTTGDSAKAADFQHGLCTHLADSAEYRCAEKSPGPAGKTLRTATEARADRCPSNIGRAFHPAEHAAAAGGILC